LEREGKKGQKQKKAQGKKAMNFLSFYFNVIFCLIPRPIPNYISRFYQYTHPMLLETNENLSRGWKRRIWWNQFMLADYIVGALLISSLDEVTGEFFFFLGGGGGF